MPDGLSRRVANTTFYDRRRDMLQWRVEWLFHCSSGGGGGGGAHEGGGAEGGGNGGNTAKEEVVKVEDVRVDESKVLSAVLDAHLAPGPGRAVRRCRLTSD